MLLPVSRLGKVRLDLDYVPLGYVCSYLCLFLVLIVLTPSSLLKKRTFKRCLATHIIKLLLHF